MGRGRGGRETSTVEPVAGNVRATVAKVMLFVSSAACLVVALLKVAIFLPSAQAGALALENPFSAVQCTDGLPFLRSVAVFGNDEREKLPSQYRALGEKIGLLHNAATNVVCTAFCVGENLIATASHCLFSRHKGDILKLSEFVFKQQLNNRSQPLYTRLAGYSSNQSRQFIVTGTSNLSRKPPIGAARDWAVVRLDRPACRTGGIPVLSAGHDALLAASHEQKLFQVAFHTDFGRWDIAYSKGCTINRSYGNLTWQNIKRHFEEPQSLILHSCDTGEASSGSPILLESERGPVVVGINVGTYQQRDVTVREGKIVRYSGFRTIANTAVSSSAFADSIEQLRRAEVLIDSRDLKTLQVNLRERGLYVGRVDGVFGTSTELAVKAFERENNLPITGLATRPMMERLLRTALPSASIDTAEGSKTPNAISGP